MKSNVGWDASRCGNEGAAEVSTGLRSNSTGVALMLEGISPPRPAKESLWSLPHLIRRTSRPTPSSIQAYRWPILAVSGLLLPAVLVAAADDQSVVLQQLLHRVEQLEGEIKTLKQAALPQVQVVPSFNPIRLEELEQKLKVVERKNELAVDAAQDKAKSASLVSASPKGFQIRSADTNFVLTFHGYVQADARYFPGNNTAGTANDTFLLRRVRPIVEGTVYGRYDFRLMLDLASGITSAAGNNGFLQDAYLNACFLPEFQVQAGKFKAPVGLERLQPASNSAFVELGYPTQLVPNRDVGIEVQGNLFDGRLTYQIAVLNGVADGSSDDQEIADNGKDFAGRLFANPFKTSSVAGLRGLGLGVSGTLGGQAGALRSLTTPGQQKFFSYRSGNGLGASTPNVVADGDHWRVSPQGYYYWGPFGLFGEYVISEQQVRRDHGIATYATFRNSAWQVIGSYILTGEDSSFGPLTPRQPYTLGDPGWGAWELVGRVGGLEVDRRAFPVVADPLTSGAGVFSWGIGVNWHLNRSIKLSLDFEHSTFDRSAATPTTPTAPPPGTTAVPILSPLLRHGENIIFSRAQVSF